MGNNHDYSLSASSSPRAGNLNWPLVLFNKDSKLQFKKIDDWTKTWWINIFILKSIQAELIKLLNQQNEDYESNTEVGI